MVKLNVISVNPSRVFCLIPCPPPGHCWLQSIPRIFFSFNVSGFKNFPRASDQLVTGLFVKSREDIRVHTACECSWLPSASFRLDSFPTQDWTLFTLLSLLRLGRGLVWVSLALGSGSPLPRTGAGKLEC